MNEHDFKDYLEAFNSRNYEKLHSKYFHPDVKLYTLGYILDGQKGVKEFYKFFHEYIDETIGFIDYHPSKNGFIGEVSMTLKAKKALTPEITKAHGFSRLTPVPEGATYDTILFVDYRLKDGKLHKIRCAEFIPPQSE